MIYNTVPMVPDDPSSIPLESDTHGEKPRPDDRTRIPEPLPVRLVAVENVEAISPPGLEEKLDAFYVQMLGFVRVADHHNRQVVYRADNFDLFFRVCNVPVIRDDYKIIGIEIPSLRELRAKLIDLEIDYEDRKSLIPGQVSIAVVDPAGNHIELTEIRLVG